MKQCIPTQTVLEMMDMVQENNSFSFANKHYIQKEGTAIGSHKANIYIYIYIYTYFIFYFINLFVNICRTNNN